MLILSLVLPLDGLDLASSVKLGTRVLFKTGLLRHVLLLPLPAYCLMYIVNYPFLSLFFKNDKLSSPAFVLKAVISVEAQGGSPATPPP